MPLFDFKKAIPALGLVAVIAGGLLIYNMLGGGFNYDLLPENSMIDNAGSVREDLVAPILNQFRINDRHYILLSDELRAEYGLPADIKESDIGEKITDITTSPDKSLIGSEVYSYTPNGGEAVVAVKKGNEYQLFQFFTFESYNNNQDEDSAEYLALYGIYKADDIAKIQFIGHSEQSKLQGLMDIRGEITDSDEISRFYSFYSVLKNSSDKYFDRLFNYKDTNSGNKGVEIDTPAPDMIAPDQIGYGEVLPMDKSSDRTDIAEDLPLVITDTGEAGAVSVDTPTANDTPAEVSPSHGLMDMGETGSGSTEPSQGSAGDALANPITIRIYNQSGIYYDSEYYINVGFISRYEVSEDFAEFMGKFLDK